jgi:hypothetical protein
MLATAALLALGCGDQPTAVNAGSVSAVAASGVLHVTNNSVRPVHYLIIDRCALALFDWIRCAGPTCPSLPGRTSLAMPYDSIPFYSAETTKEAVVYWWYSVSDGSGGYRPEGLWSVLVPLEQ